MTDLSGKNLYLDFQDTVLDTDFRAFSSTETGGVVDASAGTATVRTYLTTLKDGTATATVLVQTGDTNTWDALTPGTVGTLNWAEEGTTVGKQRHLVYAYVTERRKTMAYADLIVADISWQFTSAVTDSTYGA